VKKYRCATGGDLILAYGQAAGSRFVAIFQLHVLTRKLTDDINVIDSIPDVQKLHF